jgi:hypothetical protein
LDGFSAAFAAVVIVAVVAALKNPHVKFLALFSPMFFMA